MHSVRLETRLALECMLGAEPIVGYRPLRRDRHACP